MNDFQPGNEPNTVQDWLTPELRRRRVADIKRRIEAGTYAVPLDEMARRLLRGKPDSAQAQRTAPTGTREAGGVGPGRANANPCP